MHYIIKAPTGIQTGITLPASKSISNRALIINALIAAKDGSSQANRADITLPQNLSDCDDTNVIVAALRHMPEEINIGAAGTAMRFLTAFLSLQQGKHVITGTERMKKRPIKVLVDALRHLGADIKYTENEGFPPLEINGKELHGGQIDIPGNVSSQYISALLMIAPCMKNGLELHLTGDIISRPYIDLTINVMHSYGARVEWSDVNTVSVKPVGYQPHPYFIENDWSAASYWYEIMALQQGKDSFVELPGLIDGSRQGDASVRHIFSLLGIKTLFRKGDNSLSSIKITKHAILLRHLDFDFINQPDLAQTFIALCPMLGITFNFKGLASLKIKETDRIEAMKTEMRKLGFVLHSRNDSELIWDGELCTPDSTPIIDTYEDHRMAMCFAPLALRLGEIRINNPQVVTKSYPNYWDDLKKAGFQITEV